VIFQGDRHGVRQGGVVKVGLPEQMNPDAAGGHGMGAQRVVHVRNRKWLHFRIHCFVQLDDTEIARNLANRFHEEVADLIT